MKQEEISKVLQEMASLTALSGRISELQIKNLQMFPLVFFNDVKEVKIEYDLSPVKTMDDSPTFSNSIVSYHLNLDEEKNNEFEKRFLALEKAVKNLFWSDIKIEVYFNNQIKYKSKKNGL